MRLITSCVNNSYVCICAVSASHYIFYFAFFCNKCNAKSEHVCVIFIAHEYNCYIHFCCRGTLESFTQIHRLTVRPLSEDLHWRGVARGNRKQQ